MNHTLSIATWNANGLLQHLSELEIFLRNERIDICLISETFHEAIICQNSSLFLLSHSADKARGGSTILIRDNILHHKGLKIESAIMQITTISIQAKNRESKISAIYCPPRYKISDWTKRWCIQLNETKSIFILYIEI